MSKIFDVPQQVFIIEEFVKGNGPTAVKNSFIEKFGPGEDGKHEKLKPQQFKHLYTQFQKWGVGTGIKPARRPKPKPKRFFRRWGAISFL